MKSLLPSIFLALSLLGVALLGNAGVLPSKVAQLLPFLLLTLFARVWLRDDRSCKLSTGAAR
ncbi:hypothetical protein GRI34_10265 [Erythrobacter aquimaris]|uniref:Uncharacterized protein n=1 Tax=Qipengyuania aquimaris TaxID=255984 RepID=A0A6I4TQC1_9SPHN|nr:hypothetical protein [Qipengyuania aquimaris]MXO96798.1 hypothetical protein [Qipengyuania aquimaris]